MTAFLLPYKMISNQHPGSGHSEGVRGHVRDLAHPSSRPLKGLYPSSVELHVYWVYRLPLRDRCKDVLPSWLELILRDIRCQS